MAMVIVQKYHPQLLTNNSDGGTLAPTQVGRCLRRSLALTFRLRSLFQTTLRTFAPLSKT
ncbi:hypothetical protein Ahy_A02g007102 isoform C [Arachis hypogaea]|nr:hypothetical protein Ahy_A02g007102 isoform C [Arachis hypogaea]